jgi:hypothetical protein
LQQHLRASFLNVVESYSGKIATGASLGIRYDALHKAAKLLGLAGEE